MLFSKLGAMFRQVSEQQAGRLCIYFWQWRQPVSVVDHGSPKEKGEKKIIACFGLIRFHSELGDSCTFAF